jgi:hypothetical protein
MLHKDDNSVIAAVHNRFRDEAELRDYLAANLSKIERGLKLLKVEARLTSHRLAGGRLDILARDRFNRVVVIEVKRTNEAARQTLHEITKYISLISDTQGIPLEEMRCIVVAIEWNELYEAFSLFSSELSYAIEGFAPASFSGDDLSLRKLEIAKIFRGPHFSPVSRIYKYSTREARASHRAQIEKQYRSLRGVRACVVDIEPIDGSAASAVGAISMIWRIPEEIFSEIEHHLGVPIGSREVYRWAGWEVEQDVILWACEGSRRHFENQPDEVRWGTPEKYESIFATSSMSAVHKFGLLESATLADSERVRELLSGVTLPFSTAVRNNHEIILKVDTRDTQLLENSVAVFFNFLDFCVEWRDAFVAEIQKIGSKGVVELHLCAGRIPHFFARLVQARRDENLTPSYMRMDMFSDSGTLLRQVYGYMSWDKHTCPASATKEVERIHGSVALATADIYRRRPHEKLEDAFPLHGFLPCVAAVSYDTRELHLELPYPGWAGTELEENSLHVFAISNPTYVARISGMLESVGKIYTRPEFEMDPVLLNLSASDLEILRKRPGYSGF